MNPTNTRWLTASIPLQMLLTWQLWWPTGMRTFPVGPAAEILAGLPNWISWLSALALAGISLLYAAGRLTERVFLPVVLSAVVVLCLIDLNRFQIWLWMWFCLWLAAWGQPQNLHITRWIIAAVYVWGGLNKLTPWFMSNFDWFCETFTLTKPLAGNIIAGYGAALFETAIGVFLLMPATRKAGRWMAIAMHLYIVLILSPLGQNWNWVAIPWNFAMMGWVWLAFADNLPVAFPKKALPVAVWVMVWVLPVLNIWQWWPESASWKMYSNTHREAVIEAPSGCPCPAMAPVWQQHATDQTRLVVDDWSYQELQVPAWNSKPHFERLLRHLQQCNTHKDSISIEILTVSRWSKTPVQLERIR